jgi:hypothetical protein
VSHVNGHFHSDLYVSVAITFCHNFSVKLFSYNNTRVYCFGHLEVIFRFDISCIKIDMVLELRLWGERMVFLRHKQLQIAGTTELLLQIFCFVLGRSQ